MAIVTITDTHLNNIANAIRGKNGTTTKYKPSEMAAAISEITTGDGGNGGDYNIAVTIDGNTQELAITDAEGSGGGDTTIEDGLITHTLESYSNDRVTSIGYGTFYRNVNLKSISFPNVTEIGGYAFWGNKLLSIIDTPKLQTVGDYAFNGNNVINLVLPEVTSVGTHSYSSMLRCETINAPKLVTTGNSCFRGSSGKLKRVDFGALEVLESMALYWNKSLDTVIIRTNKVCSLNATNVFTGTKIASGTGYVYVPDELVEEYKVATNWSTFASQIKGLSEL